MTDENTTDGTEQPSRDELENRVEQLEQTVQQMLPSRRDALKLGGTALAAGALGSAATGSASAGTNSVGTIGSASSPVDAELEDINPGSTRAVEFNQNDITAVSSLSTDELNGGVTGSTSITDMTGTNLSISNGSLVASASISTVNTPSLSLGTWRQASSDAPADVELVTTCETDGSSNGQIDLQIDSSGGTTANFSRIFRFVNSNNAPGTGAINRQSFTVRAGAQYRLRNVSDPSNGNSLRDVREVIR